MRSKASFLQTAEAGDAMISSQADFETEDMSLRAGSVAGRYSPSNSSAARASDFFFY